LTLDASTALGVCDNEFATARKLLILKRRDAGAVDQARLESDSGDAHEVTLTLLAAHAIQRFTASR
jgi:hypothetical protein